MDGDKDRSGMGWSEMGLGMVIAMGWAGDGLGRGWQGDEDGNASTCQE